MKNSIALSSHTWVKMHRTEALKKQDGKCIWCISTIGRHTATAEHMRCKSNGGSDEKDNITAACSLCNTFRGVLSVSRFKKIIRSKKNSSNFNIYQRQVAYRLNKRTNAACKRIIQAV